jgi:2-polyprenyl-3-methyl-5-hydroxy-6-metoxy-1,4-benzoquinol methylase
MTTSEVITSTSIASSRPLLLPAGLLAIPLALKGANVSASDISSAMVEETERRYNAVIAGGAAAPSSAPKFEAMDLESASGKYDLVTCLDVMIHYPQVRTLPPLSALPCH